MTFIQWLLANVGRSVDLDGAYGPQCMDAINSYLQLVPQLPRATGNARDVPDQTIHGMIWTPNGPTNHPPAGGIVVWRPGRHGQVTISAYGHVGIAVIADKWGLITADQNWLDRPSIQLCLHNYDGVWGWYAPTPAQA